MVASPRVKYTDQITTSPVPTTDDFLSPLPRTAPARDDDRSDVEGYSTRSQPFPPNSRTGKVPRPGRRTLAQSTRRRTTLRTTTVNRTNTVSTQNPSIPPGTRLRLFKTSLANLVTPSHKVGESPGFMRELKSILFGTCASRHCICFHASSELTPGSRVQRAFVGNTSLCKP